MQGTDSPSGRQVGSPSSRVATVTFQPRGEILSKGVTRYISERVQEQPQVAGSALMRCDQSPSERRSLQHTVFSIYHPFGVLARQLSAALTWMDILSLDVSPATCLSTALWEPWLGAWSGHRPFLFTSSGMVPTEKIQGWDEPEEF